MQASYRIIVNTLVQYSRTAINVLLSLYSARLVLLILGQSDFGLYSLIGGVVALLSFLTNSLVVSTQRFLNVYQGRGDMNKIKEVFSNSLVLHFVLGLIAVVIFEALAPFLFNGFLNIPTGRDEVAVIVYHQVVAMVFISLLMSPYRALLVSRENIVYTSVIDVIDGVLKLFLVLLLPYFAIDTLVMYGWMMLGIRLFNILAFAIYDHFKYEECVFPKLIYLNKGFFKDLSSFTGWILYSSFCITMRNQGFAIVINKLLGTVANAAYGIGNQISGYVSFISSSFNTAIGPQLMKSEGADDRDRMIRLAEIQGRISYLLLGCITIPLCFVMYPVLKLWLKEVPDNAEVYAMMVLIGILVDQPSTGLAQSIQAVGKMKFYTIMAFTPKFFILPCSWFIFRNGGSAVTVMIVYLIIETAIMLERIWLARRVISFDVNAFCKNIFIPIAWPTLISVVVCTVIYNSMGTESLWSVFCVLTLGFISFIFASYSISLSPEERSKILSIGHAIKARIFN